MNHGRELQQGPPPQAEDHVKVGQLLHGRPVEPRNPAGEGAAHSQETGTSLSGT
jgi:hypothetical protein